MSEETLLTSPTPLLRAREYAKAGLFNQAAGLLHPLLTDPNERPYALESLAECHRGEGDLALACYLYKEATRCNRDGQDLVAVSKDTEGDYEKRINTVRGEKPGILLLLFSLAALTLGALLYAGTVPSRFAEQFRLFFDVDALKYAAAFRVASIACGIGSLFSFFRWTLKRLRHRRRLRNTIGEDPYGPRFIDCWACQLRYRKNQKVCPYCGNPRKKPKPTPLPPLTAISPVISPDGVQVTHDAPLRPPPLPPEVRVGWGSVQMPTSQGMPQATSIPPSERDLSSSLQPPPLPSAGQSAEPAHLPSPPTGPSNMAGPTLPPPLPRSPATVPGGLLPVGNTFGDTRFEPLSGGNKPSGDTQSSTQTIGTRLFMLVLLLLVVAFLLYSRSTRSLGPGETVQQCASALAQGRPQDLWDILPGKYQQDVEVLIREFSRVMDDEVWKASFALADRVVAVADAKRDVFVDVLLEDEGASVKDPNEMHMARKALDISLEAAKEILKSDLRNLDSLRSPSVRKWLAGPVANAAKGLAEFIPKTEGDVGRFVADLRSMKTSLVTLEKDTATIQIEVEGESPENLQMARIDGRWLPAELVHQWPETISSVKQEIMEMGQELKQNKVMYMAGLGAVNAMVDAFAKEEKPLFPFEVSPGISHLFGFDRGTPERTSPSPQHGVLDGILQRLGAATPMKKSEVPSQ